MTVVQTDLTGSATLDSVDPTTGEVLGTVPIHGPAEIDATLARAREAAAAWGALSVAERTDALIGFRRALANDVDEMAALIHAENGKPLFDATQEVLASVLHLDHAAKRAPKVLGARKVSTGFLANYSATVSYHPLGVIGVIGPWNYPLFTPMGSIGYALAAGNAVVFKPSELTPLVGVRLAEIAEKSLPVPNLLQVVTGDGSTGGALASSKVDKLAFTGSAGTGRRVMEAAAKNLTPVVLELGGKDPMIVAADADVDKAAKAAVYGALTNSGQACISVERAYVVERVYDRFVEVAAEEAAKVTAGGADAHYGAMTRPQQVEQVREQLADAVDKGATVLVGGPDGIDGNVIPPTVLVGVTDDMLLMQDETFGPVLPIIKVSDADEAVRLANDSPFGLGSSVFAKAGAGALADKVKAGMTAVNSVMTFSTIPSLPFGGSGESGFGRIHGDEGLREFARVKSTTHEKFASPIGALAFTDNPKSGVGQTKMLLKAAFGGGPLDKLTELARHLPGR